MSPAFIRADVPIDISFDGFGPAPAQVSYSIDGVEFPCTPKPVEGRFLCTHAGIDPRGFSSGGTTISVESGASVATATATIDFDCPTFKSLSVTPPVASVMDQALLAFEVSEPLGALPKITRAGLDWGAPIGLGRSFVLIRVVTDQDTALDDIVISLVDRAGNRSTDCGGEDGRLAFLIDLGDPLVEPSKILLSRGAPFEGASISADAGAFIDDAGIAEVRVFDETGEQLLLSFTPEPDGSAVITPLPALTGGRVLVQAVDPFGGLSSLVSVAEHWRLSLGQGAHPGAEIKTAARLSAEPYDSRSMSQRTVELASDVLADDALSAVVTAAVGFEDAGTLASSYEDTFQIAGGYDEVGRAVVAFGGRRLNPNNPGFDEYDSRTLVLRWDDRASVYQAEVIAGAGQVAPTRRSGFSLAFDDAGCGLLYGGRGLDALMIGNVLLDDLWQICLTGQTGQGPGQSYEWTQLSVDNPGAGPGRRLGPLVYDRAEARYFIAGGYSYMGSIFPMVDPANFFLSDRAFYLSRGAGVGWAFTEEATPASFVGRENHLVYYDERLQTFGFGLGRVEVGDFGRGLDFWDLSSDGWTQGAANAGTFLKQGFGAGYDAARAEVVLWGDNGGQCLPDPCVDPQASIWIKSSTISGTATDWRVQNLDTPVTRAFPSLIYDRDRESFVIFGGVRFDGRAVPPQIFSLTTEPSYPYFHANITLGAQRPKGIIELNLRLRVRGLGDGDSVGPGSAAAGGVEVRLWDEEAQAWEVVATIDGPSDSITDSTFGVLDRPERFVTPTGVVPVSIRPLHPGTLAVEGALEVDLIDGRLVLAPGVPLN